MMPYTQISYYDRNQFPSTLCFSGEGGTQGGPGGGGAGGGKKKTKKTKKAAAKPKK